MSSNLSDLSPQAQKARARILLAYGLDEAGNDVPQKPENPDSLGGLDLETSGQSLEELRERDNSVDREVRAKAIAEARQASESLRETVDDLRIRSVDLLEDDHPTIVELDKRIEAESLSRGAPQFTLTEPSWDEFQKARRSAADALRTLKAAADSVSKAMEVEVERRVRELQRIDEQRNNEPISTLTLVLDRCRKYLPETSPVPAQLAKHSEQLQTHHQEVGKCVRAGKPRTFDSAAETIRKEIEKTVESLKVAEQAEVEERNRRKSEVQRLTQLFAEPRFANLDSVSNQLTPLVAKDKRLKPFDDGLKLNKSNREATLLKLSESLEGNASEFDSIGRDVTKAHDDLAVAIKSAADELAARHSFLEFTRANKAILEWGDNAVFADNRIDTFKDTWRQCNHVKTWSTLQAQQLPSLQNQLAGLDAAKLDVEAVERDTKTADTKLKAADTCYGDVVKYCEALEFDLDDIAETYPKASALHAAFADYSADNDKLTLQNVVRMFPELTDALREVQRIIATWTTLVDEAQPEVVKLKELFSQLPLVKGAVVIIWTQTLKKKEIVDKLPWDCGNSDRVAGDILNHPSSGSTGFTVGGRTVYHSSAGSGSQSKASMGTAFWILQGDDNSPREIIAMGKHDPDSSQSDEYVIHWIASGVSVFKNKKNQKIVKLNDQVKKLS